jgi:FkbM family methyltransferase
MRKVIQKIANALGYHVSRHARSVLSKDFADIQRLCSGLEAPVIFDVGAHHGEVTAQFRMLFPGAEIYAFEPFVESYEIVKKKTAADARIHVFNHGLSDKEGVLAFHSNKSSATNSLLPTDESSEGIWRSGQLETQEIIEARFRTLDLAMADLGVDRINVLKLDVQGAEALVIRGAENACRLGKIGLIYTEIITQPTYTGQKRFDESLAIYYDHGFDLHSIYNLSLTPQGCLRQMDAIFIWRG